MNEMHFVFKVRQYLNRELHELPPSTHSRLQAARERALARQKVAAHQSILATAGNFVQEHAEGLHLRQILVALAPGCWRHFLRLLAGRPKHRRTRGH
jgi:hypothetical protein